jgi:hypothetical protein
LVAHPRDALRAASGAQGPAVHDLRELFAKFPKAETIALCGI